MVPENSWSTAPNDAIIFGLKELPSDTGTLKHRHILFGHAYKGQPDGQDLLKRFSAGGGALYDLEYLTDDVDRRVAAFGYWAGFAGAAMLTLCWAAQQKQFPVAPAQTHLNSKAMIDHVLSALDGINARPSAIVIGALGRVGTGASDFCATIGSSVTKWDIDETAAGGPFPEILDHEIFLNCILATPSTPVFLPKSAAAGERRLSVIGDIAFDPDNDFHQLRSMTARHHG